MDAYLIIKTLHILGACVLLGTGAGIAFFLLVAHLSGDRRAFGAVSRWVVLADWVFTAPAVVWQLGSGLWLAQAMGIPWGSRWMLLVLALYAFVGMCWLPVVWIQIRLSRLAEPDVGGARYRRMVRTWIALGVPAFAAALWLLYLMVAKPGIGELVFQRAVP